MHRCILTAFIALSTACGGSRLPTERPPDFSIGVESSGGMLPVSSRVRCDATGCAWSSTDNGVAVPEKTHPTSPAQLDALYGVVREQAFDRIRLEKHELIYDAGGVRVHVTAAGKTYDLGNSATEGVAKGDESRYQAVIAAVESLVASLRAGDASSSGSLAPRGPASAGSAADASSPEVAMDRSCDTDADCVPAPTCCPVPCNSDVINRRELTRAQNLLACEPARPCMSVGACRGYAYVCARRQCKLATEGDPDFHPRN